jgi:Bacterial Ig-like domain (group 1).
MNICKKGLSLLAASILLTACGGGGTDISGGTSTSSTSGSTSGSTSSSTTTNIYSMAVKACSTADAVNCNVISEASLEQPNYVAAQLLDLNSKPVSGKVVTATADRGTIKPSSGKITDVNGYAVFSLTSTSLTDAGELSNITFNSTSAAAATESLPFGSQADLALSFSFSSGLVTTALPQGGTTSLNIVVTLNGQPYKTPVQVNLSSPCKTAGKAVFSDSVTTDTNGLATATYKGTSADGALACSGSDVVQAELATDTTKTQTVTVVNQLAASSTIVAGSPSPAFIRLKGYNGNTSTVTFSVKNAQNTAVPNQKVDFSFALQNANSNGYSLSPASAITNDAGQVSVTVNAGTIPVPIAVKAYLDSDNTIQTVSQPIAVGTGYPDSDSFSFSADVYSLEGKYTDGSIAKITMRLADRFNNPIPDGTKVYFTTEGGSIKGDYTDSTTGSTPDCITSDSSCTATLTTMSPRPDNGRVTVLAYTEGEESFTDLNGNGIFDSGDLLASTGMPYFDDISEPFLDENYDGNYTAGEWFLDVNGNTKWDKADGIYHGLACDDTVVADGKCVKSTVQLYKNAEFIFSSITDASLQLEQWNGSKWVATSGPLNVAVAGYYRVLPYNIAKSGNLNPLPSGAQVSISTTNGGDIVTARPAGFSAGIAAGQESNFYLAYSSDIDISHYPDISAKTDSNATRAYYYYFEVKPETTPNGKTTGTLTIKASTGGGAVSLAVDANDLG